MQRKVMIGVVLAASGIATADGNHCEITVTGDSTASIKLDAPAVGAQGKLAASTDYWLSDSQLRSAVSVMSSFGKDTPAQKQKKAEDAMKRDPRFMLLMINCLGDDGGLILSPAGKAHYADVPMKPGTYPIVGQGAKVGDFTLMFHLSPGGKRESYAVKEPGKLVLTQFDKKGIAGTFTFGASQAYKGTKHVNVTGKFSYRCAGEACDK